MLGCTEAVTLVRHIREDDGDRYVCVPIMGASWYRKISVAVTPEGARPVSTCVCRIPEVALAADTVPAVGEFIVHGTVLAVTRAPEDFGPLDYMQITSVGDNRRGRLRHWRADGA